METFNGYRLNLARKRRQLTAKGLADLASVAPLTITRLEKGHNVADPETVEKLSQALDYPKGFFYKDDPDNLDPETISFRSLKRMTSKVRNAATSAGELGLELSEWVDNRFRLAELNLLDLGQGIDPSSAAHALRQHWRLGEKPIGDMIGLLESNGIKVLSLAEALKDMDAFSFWKNNKAYVFLNTIKTPERSIFDTAHELGHLVMHRHAGMKSSPNAEKEADAFASAFLMPEKDVISRMPRRPITVNLILQAKKRWRVSAMAMAYRLHKLGIVSDWQYKSLCISLTKLGYRTSEPDGIERETSKVWDKILRLLWSEGVTKNDIAKDLHIPLSELEVLIWGLTGTPTTIEQPNSKPTLTIV